TDVDVDLIRIGARNVDRMDAAGGAEGMARRAGVEPVSGQRILAADEFERVGRDDEMQKAFLAAHRTIAFGHARKIAGHAKAHAPAMTASFVVLQRHLSAHHDRACPGHRRPLGFTAMDSATRPNLTNSNRHFPRRTTRTAPDRAPAPAARDGGRRGWGSAGRAGAAAGSPPG